MKVRKLSESELKELRKRAKRDKSGLISHLLTSYLTVFENACDQNSDVLEFKPEILEALEARKYVALSK